MFDAAASVAGPSWEKSVAPDLPSRKLPSGKRAASHASWSGSACGGVPVRTYTGQADSTANATSGSAWLSRRSKPCSAESSFRATAPASCARFSSSTASAPSHGVATAYASSRPFEAAAAAATSSFPSRFRTGR